jgi:predicted nucleic acid-binding protein
VISPDTSVVVAALAPWHEAHVAASRALADGEVRLVAHVGFEATSTLSRMPEGSRISPSVVLQALERRFPGQWLALDGQELGLALRRAVGAGIRGGALYDALIAATAARHGARVVTADRRARAAYDAMGAESVILQID